MVKNATIIFRIENHLKEKLEKLASEDHRSLSNYLQLMLEEYVKSK